MGPYVALLLALLVSLVPFPAEAEPAGGGGVSTYDDLISSSLEELMDIDLVYGASRYEQKISRAPSSVSIITAEEIKRYGYRNLADILAATRSFYITSDRSYQYLGVRGMLLQGDYNSRVLLMIDGHRMNDALYGAAAVSNELPLDVDLIQRVEVIRGSGYSIYGNNAFLAIINIITRDGGGLSGPELSADAGSHDTYRGRASFGHRFTGGQDLIVSWTQFSSQGHSRLYFSEFDDPATNGGYAKYVDDESDYDIFAKLSWKGFTLEGAYGRRDKTDPAASYGTFFGSPSNVLSDRQGCAELRYDGRINRFMDLMAKVYYDYYYFKEGFLYDWNEGVPPPDLVLNVDEDCAERWGAEFQLMIDPHEDHRLVFGGRFIDRFRVDQANYDIGVGVYLNDRRRSINWGLYLQDEFRIRDDLALTAAVGYDYFETFGSSVNPRVALVYNPTDSTSVKLLYSTAYREPTGYELYYHDGYSTAKPNPDLNEEKAANYEIVAEQRLTSDICLTASVFYTRIEDIIRQEVDPADGLEAFVNRGDVDIIGAELEALGRWENGIEARASYSFQEAETSSTEKHLENSPKHLAKLNLSVPVIGEMLRSGLELQFTGKRGDFKGGHLEEYLTANLTLLSRGIVEGLDISGTVYNLFNDKHSDPVGEEFRQRAIEQDGIGFRFKITYLYDLL